MTSFSASPRRLFAVDGSPPVRTAPRYDGTASIVDNAAALALWLFGPLRAEWAAALAADVGAAVDCVRPAADDSGGEPAQWVAAQWVAAVLWAAAVDSGKDRRPAAWSRVVHGITDVTGVPHETVLARGQDLRDRGLLRPRVLPPYWRAQA